MSAPDAYDAILQHLYRKVRITISVQWRLSHIGLFQTLGTIAVLRRSSGQTQMGVCLRIGPGTFRVYPNTEYLEPFEHAVRQLNPEVAVKVFNATINAALAKLCVHPSLEPVLPRC